MSENEDRKAALGETAQHDLLNLLAWSIERWGYEQAAEYKALIDATIAHLASFPQLGRSVDHLRKGFHRFHVRPYFIYYTFTNETLRVQRILHERQRVTRKSLSDS
jgi:toxin ParE1/3/4